MSHGPDEGQYHCLCLFLLVFQINLSLFTSNPLDPQWISIEGRMHLQYDQAKMNRCSDLFLSLFYSIFFSSSQLSLALTVATSQMLMFFFFPSIGGLILDKTVSDPNLAGIVVYTPVINGESLLTFLNPDSERIDLQQVNPGAPAGNG